MPGSASEGLAFSVIPIFSTQAFTALGGGKLAEIPEGVGEFFLRAIGAPVVALNGPGFRRPGVPGGALEL